MGTDVTMGGSNGEYTITGSLYGSQGYGTAANPETSSRVSLSLDLPADSGNWLYTVTDQMTDSDYQYPGGNYTCQIGGQGILSEMSCSAPMTSSQFKHDPGTPLRIAFLFGEPLYNYGESFQEQFSVTLSEVGRSAPPVTTPTPQPPSFALLGLPLVGFALLRCHLALPRRDTTSV